MRLQKARITKYRSIRDSGWFDIERTKTILVGPNEAGKTVLLQALQQLNPPSGTRKFDVLRDYPRSEYNDVTTNKVNPSTITVVQAYFELEPEDQVLISQEYRSCSYVFGRRYDNSTWHRLEGGANIETYGNIKRDLARLCSHVDRRIPRDEASNPLSPIPSVELEKVTKGWVDEQKIEGENAKALNTWLSQVLQYVDEANATEDERHRRLVYICHMAETRQNVLNTLKNRLFRRLCRAGLVKYLLTK